MGVIRPLPSHINQEVLGNMVPALENYLRYKVQFGLVLSYINHCWLFNAKSSLYIGWCPHGVMVKAMDCGIVVSEFAL